MNYVPIVVATDLEVHSVLKKGCQYFCLYSVCTSHWCLVMSFYSVSPHEEGRGLKIKDERCNITPAGVTHNSLHKYQTVHFAEIHNTQNSFNAILMIVYVAMGGCYGWLLRVVAQ